jgi:hypothetical protein
MTVHGMPSIKVMYISILHGKGQYSDWTSAKDAMSAINDYLSKKISISLS